MRIAAQCGALIVKQKVAAFFQTALFRFLIGGFALQFDSGVHQFIADLRQHPNRHIVNQRAIAKVIIEGGDFQLRLLIAHHAVRAGANRLAGKLTQRWPFARQDHRADAGQQPWQPIVRLAQMDIQRPGRGRLQFTDVRKQRLAAHAFQRSNHILHFQFTTMMKTDRRAQEEAPLQRRGLLPVMGDIGFDFPLFLIYAHQAVENLSRQMGFRAAQRRTGQQIGQRTVIEYAQNVFALAEAAT